jgi:hypothetical protein
MADTIKHRHQTAIAPTGADVDQAEWNDSHVMSGGTDGQAIIRNSAVADGWSWGSVSAKSGAHVLLEEHSFSGAATTSFTTRNMNGLTGNTFQSDYDRYVIELFNVVLATNDQGITGNVITGVGVDTSAVYGRTFEYGAANNTTNGGGEVGQTRWNVSGNQSNAAGVGGACAEMSLYSPLSAFHKQMIGMISWTHTTVDYIGVHECYIWKSTTAIVGIQFGTTSGTMTGTIRVSGVSH